MNQNTIDNRLTYDKLSVIDLSPSKIDAKEHNGKPSAKSFVSVISGALLIILMQSSKYCI